MRNLNLLFNKEYYQKLGTPDFRADVEKNNKKLTEERFDYDRDYIKPPMENCQSFALKVVYPGLLIGTGNPHGVGKLKDDEKSDDKDDSNDNVSDIDFGFYFDYVTGQPVIPGSSVKGVLRSHFKYHTEAVAEILKNNGYPEITTETVIALEKYIFDYSDIFFDAVVRKGDSGGRLLGFDFITPHSSPTKNPNPNRIIKVLPEVEFEFRFRIDGKEINGLKFSAGKIKWLFQELILLFGAGAKSNEGYGVFDNKGVEQPKNSKKDSNEGEVEKKKAYNSREDNGSKKKKGKNSKKQNNSNQNKPLKGFDSLAVLLD